MSMPLSLEFYQNTFYHAMFLIEYMSPLQISKHLETRMHDRNIAGMLSQWSSPTPFSQVNCWMKGRVIYSDRSSVSRWEFLPSISHKHLFQNPKSEKEQLKIRKIRKSIVILLQRLKHNNQQRGKLLVQRNSLMPRGKQRTGNMTRGIKAASTFLEAGQEALGEKPPQSFCQFCWQLFACVCVHDTICC